MLPRVTDFTTYCIYNYIFVRVAHSVEVLKLIRRVHANKKGLFLRFTLGNSPPIWSIFSKCPPNVLHNFFLPLNIFVDAFTQCF